MAAPTALAPVIPLRGNERYHPAQGDKSDLPAPSQLYCLVVIALFLHKPDVESGACKACLQTWPCEQMRRAGHLIELF